MADASSRGRSNRRKGQTGERELANTLGPMLGLDLRRRVRNHEGDSDIVGLDGFAVEVKVQAIPCLRSWWEQTVDQASNTGDTPVLFYRLPRRKFRAVVSLYPFMDETTYESLHDFDLTIDMGLEAFAALYEFIHARRGERIIAERDYLGIKPN